MGAGPARSIARPGRSPDSRRGQRPGSGHRPGGRGGRCEVAAEADRGRPSLGQRDVEGSWPREQGDPGASTDRGGGPGRSLGVSERRACRVVAQHRSTQRRSRRRVPDLEVTLRTRLRQIAREHPRWGWKTAYWIVRRRAGRSTASASSGYGLRRPQLCRKPRRLGPTLTGRLRACRSSQVWDVDFQFDETADRRRIKLATIVDASSPAKPWPSASAALAPPISSSRPSRLSSPCAAPPSICGWTTARR